MREKGKKCMGGLPFIEDPSHEVREGWREERLWV